MQALLQYHMMVIWNSVIRCTKCYFFFFFRKKMNFLLGFFVWNKFFDLCSGSQEVDLKLYKCQPNFQSSFVTLLEDGSRGFAMLKLRATVHCSLTSLFPKGNQLGANIQKWLNPMIITSHVNIEPCLPITKCNENISCHTSQVESVYNLFFFFQICAIDAVAYIVIFVMPMNRMQCSNTAQVCHTI